MVFKTFKRGLLGILSIPDTEKTRYMAMDELINPAHAVGVHDRLGTTPMQSVMTVARWATLGKKETNLVEAPDHCQVHWDYIKIKGTAIFQHGRQDEVWALVMDLLTRMLSPNPTLYERALLNTKGAATSTLFFAISHVIFCHPRSPHAV